MAVSAHLGPKVRTLRRREGLTQVQLAKQLEISASYLNLIEHNRRPLTAPLLIRLARQFQLDLSAFAEDDHAGLLDDLHEVFGDPLFEEYVLTNKDMQDLAVNHPEAARAVRALYGQYRETREVTDDLATRLSDDHTLEGVGQLQLPSEEVGAFVQRHSNYFGELDEAAEALWVEAELNRENVWAGLKRRLETKHEVRVHVVPAGDLPDTLRWYHPDRRELQLSELLPSRSRKFQLARQLALLEHDGLLTELASDPELTTEASRKLARVVLSNYLGAATLMPYGRFFRYVKRHRYDIEVLADRFNTSFEQVCHRLTTLKRPGSEGIPLHMVRVDIAGNISKRFSMSGLRFPRFGAGCPKWAVYQAFLTPETIRVQISQDTNNQLYFCLAKTVRKTTGPYIGQPRSMHAIGIGCALEHASELVYADRLSFQAADDAVPIGSTCRMCSRAGCAQRAFPSFQHPLRLDENVSHVSAYGAPASLADAASGRT